jgi:hypothetical protein
VPIERGVVGDHPEMSRELLLRQPPGAVQKERVQPLRRDPFGKGGVRVERQPEAGHRSVPRPHDPAGVVAVGGPEKTVEQPLH